MCVIYVKMCGTHIVQYFSYFCLELYNILNVYIISVCVLFIKFQQKDTFLTITVRINVPCMTNLLFHNKIPKKTQSLYSWEVQRASLLSF